MKVHAHAASGPKAPFKPFEYDLPAIGPEQVDIAVKYCGICHSDLSMLDNEWGITAYPFVGGHEVVGTVRAIGERVPAGKVKVGDTVGLGWYAASCMHCRHCMHGDHNLCQTAEQTIVNRHGGFADTVRGHWSWATVLPKGVDPASAGPLFCGGITVFNPIVQHDIRPTQRVGVIGIGGLGHLALMFLNKWGCEVTAFSTSADKEKEARGLGAHHFINTKDKGALEKVVGRFDMILNTANASLDWDAYMGALAPRGVLHTVGVVGNTFGPTHVFPMIGGQKSFSGSPLGSPATTADMLDFCARHKISPVTERYPMKAINDAFEKLRNGSPRYRLVLEV